MQNLLQENGSNVTYAWQDPQYELQAQTDLNDPNATYYPTGELVFTLIPSHTIQYNMDPMDYRLAWKFDIHTVAPFTHKDVYVDAHSGIIINEYELVCSNGTADIANHGSKTIDTKYIGLFQNYHILRSNDATTNVHTRKHTGPNFNNLPDVTNSTAAWGNNNWKSTNAHWAVTQAWSYFVTAHSRIGMSNSFNFNKVKVYADKSWQTSTQSNPYKNGAYYTKSLGMDYIISGHLDSLETQYTGEISILAHEYTHGVTRNTAHFNYFNESGALDESFADIFGFLTKRNALGGNDWLIGSPNYDLQSRRSLKTPKLAGLHYDPLFPSVWSDGQPDTYGGEFWLDYTVYGNDRGGVHINSGVQNFWFYLLSQGGSGTNDLNDLYSVNGIGIVDAARIAYYNLENCMHRNSTFNDAMTGSIESAERIFGECSAQAIATEEAWFAVGLGTGSTCEGAGISEINREFIVYPNPAQNYIQLEFSSAKSRNIQLFNINGQLMRTIISDSEIETIDISDLSNGIYFIKENGRISKIIKN